MKYDRDGDGPELRIVERFRKCGRATVGQFGALTMNGAGTAGMSGIETCGRAMVCPTCGVRVREARRDHLHDLLTAHLGSGGRAYFVTLTLRHSSGMKLADSLAVIRSAWASVTDHSRFKAYHKQYGLGMVSAVEVTQGPHGWHPHLHLVLFQGISREHPVTMEQLPDGRTTFVRSAEAPKPWSNVTALQFADWLTTRWCDVVTTKKYRDRKTGQEKNFPRPLPEYAVDWRECEGADDVEGLSRYLTKDTTEAAALRMYGLSAEITRGDNKTGRMSNIHKTKPVFDLVVDANIDATTDKERKTKSRGLRMWREYEKAMRGLRWWRVSIGLPAALGVKADDRTDEEIDQEQVGEGVILVPSSAWWFIASRKGHLPALLRRLEEVGPSSLFVELVIEGTRHEGMQHPGRTGPHPLAALTRCVLCVDFATGTGGADWKQLDTSTGELVAFSRA